MIVHVRFNGRSTEYGDLDLKPEATDTDIRQRIAQRMDVGVEQLNGHVVDRGPSGDVVLRPEAVYG